MTIQQMRQLYSQGKSITAILTAAGLDDADPAEWRKILSAKRSKRGKRRNSTSRRQPTAAQTMQRLCGVATLELVERVNNERQAATPAPAIPFMGEPGNSEDVADDYGLAAGVDF